MRILMVAPQPFFRPRGTPFSILQRLRGLTRLGHHVELVTYPFGETPELPGVVVHRAARPPGVRDVGIGPSVAKLLLDGPVFARAVALGRSERFDLLHTHEEAGVLGAWMSRASGVPHIYDMHSSLPEQLANFGRFNWRPIVAAFRALERYTLARSDGVIAVCPSLRDLVLASGYAGPVAMIENTLDVTPAPPDAADVEAITRALRLGRGPVVLYAGTLEPYQGLELLIEAAPLVLRRLPDVHFVVLGGSESEGSALARLAAAAGAAGAFRFLPAVPPPDVWRYYAVADALVTCRTRGMNTPLKIYQYLRAGRPIVATAIGSHTQVLDDTTAELVTPTPDGIAAGLLRVLTDAPRAAALVAGARRLVEERMTDEHYLARLATLLDTVVRRRPAAAAA